MSEKAKNLIAQISQRNPRAIGKAITIVENGTELCENILNELKTAKASSVENGYSHYEAVVDILTAYTLLQATDVWDDMPYTEAMQGIDNVNPAYDTQASIYTAALAQLDNAITLIGGAAGAVAPGSEDVYYGGDMAKWALAAHAIKARAFVSINRSTSIICI